MEESTSSISRSRVGERRGQIVYLLDSGTLQRVTVGGPSRGPPARALLERLACSPTPGRRSRPYRTRRRRFLM